MKKLFLVLLLLFIAGCQENKTIDDLGGDEKQPEGLFGTSFSYTYDTATPAGTDAPSVIDDRIREAKAATQERLNVDHYFALTGTQVSNAAAGEHRQISFYAPISTPTYAANKGFLYMKDASDVVELHWLDESDNEVQITSGGEILYTSVGDVANDTYITAVDNAGTGTASLIKADVNDAAVLPDDARLATNAAPDEDEEIANKKYVDDQVAAVGWGDWTTTDSDSESFAVNHSYKVTSDGFVVGYFTTGRVIENLTFYTDSSNPPTTAVYRIGIYANNDVGGFCVPVKEDEYWKIAISNGTLTSCQFIPLGTGECQDQN